MPLSMDQLRGRPLRDPVPTFPRYYGTDLGMMSRTIMPYDKRDPDNRSDRIYVRPDKRVSYRGRRNNRK